MAIDDRLEIRLDEEHSERLAKAASRLATTPSEAIRVLIQDSYEAALREARRHGLRMIAEAEAEDVPDSEELNRQLDRAYDVAPLY
jgi:antitoxin component of RelBE/YafQ-DinJ toxin-antitoxin module